MLRLIRVREAARHLVIAVLVTGGVLLGGTTGVAAGESVPTPAHAQPVQQSAQSVSVPSHSQPAEQAVPTSRPAWGHPTTSGVHPNYDHRIPGLVVGNPYLSGKQAANVSSGNWAGLAQVGATYTGVSASWTVPTILSVPSTAVSSSWIGIDGFSNQDLIQAGTEQDISGGVASYYAWYEILPAPETVIGGVNPGDHMTADIFQVSPPTATAQGTWTISITDLTSGHNFTNSFPYGGGGTNGQPANSAEWIEEMTGVSPGPQPPLANFGTANFTNLNYTTSNPTGNTPTLIRMVNGSHATTAFPTIPGASDLNVTYGQPSTQTAVTANPGSPTLGTSVTYSATVTGGTPSGSVTFSTGSTSLCTATLSSGSGSCSATAAPLGTDLIFGTYSGGAGLSASTGTTTLTVTKAPTQTGVTAVASTGTLGSSVTYKATVTTSTTGLPTPTGSVTFTAGSTSLCTATLSSGSGSCSATTAPVGSDTISGAYTGDTDFSGSTGTTSLVVNPAASQTSIGASPSPVAVGSSVTYSTTVSTSVPGLPTPTGTVTFTTGPTSLCTATLMSNGSGTCSSTAAPGGTDTISGAYSGDANFSGSNGTTSLVVEEPSQTGQITASPSPVTVGTPVSYSATVTTNVTGLSTTPTGSVTFSTSSTSLCTATVSNTTGIASCPSSAAPPGTDTISATYSGDSVFAGSSGTTPLVVNKAASQTSIGANFSSVAHGASVTYSATVTTSAPGVPTPTGSVTFSTGSTPLCTAPLSNGVITCTSSMAPVGTDMITGTYAGNTVFSGSSGTTTLVVNSPPPPPPQPTHGYWLVGSDGGIFTFGSAQFHGSTGSLRLQRPVVGIVPTASRGGYWLDASDGGIFAFGDAGFYGSIPGLGLHPAGSGLLNSLNAPIVGMVPSSDGGGYFMVASDGGIFAFGDAHFAGSCPGIVGGCSGAAVAVMPDASGNGYWLVTQSGHVYTFGDAPYYGAPGPQGSPVTSAVRTPDGNGYWILFANGAIDGYGDAGNFGSPAGQMGGFNPANAIFTTGDGSGYWVAAADGAVANYGNAPNDGSMLGTALNGSIIAATGW
jgi:hypothetical protein